MSKLTHKPKGPGQLSPAIVNNNAKELRREFVALMLSQVARLESQDVDREEILEECCEFLCRLGLQRYNLNAQNVMHAMMGAFLKVASIDWPPEIVWGDQGLKLGWLPNGVKMPIDVMSEWHPEASCEREVLEIAEAVRRHIHEQLHYQHKPMGWTDTASDAGQENYNDE